MGLLRNGDCNRSKFVWVFGCHPVRHLPTIGDTHHVDLAIINMPFFLGLAQQLEQKANIVSILNMRLSG